jgi:hypothetical protein
VKSAKSSTNNFDHTPKVQKNKPTPYCLTEFHGTTGKNNCFPPRGHSFWAKMFFLKMTLEIYAKIRKMHMHNYVFISKDKCILSSDSESAQDFHYSM